MAKCWKFNNWKQYTERVLRQNIHNNSKQEVFHCPWCPFLQNTVLIKGMKRQIKISPFDKYKLSARRDHVIVWTPRHHSTRITLLEKYILTLLKFLMYPHCSSLFTSNHSEVSEDAMKCLHFLKAIFIFLVSPTWAFQHQIPQLIWF